MKQYNSYAGVNLTGRSATPQHFDIGDDVDLADGVYMGDSALVVVNGGTLVWVDTYVVDKDDNSINVSDLMARRGPISGENITTDITNVNALNGDNKTSSNDVIFAVCNFDNNLTVWFADKKSFEKRDDYAALKSMPTGGVLDQNQRIMVDAVLGRIGMPMHEVDDGADGVSREMRPATGDVNYVMSQLIAAGFVHDEIYQDEVDPSIK